MTKKFYLALVLPLFLSSEITAQNAIRRDADKLIKPPKEQKIYIDTNKIQSINELQKKFAKTKTLELAQTISEEYFNIGNYTAALEWSLKANEINPSSEYAWIMYAKSQFRLGNKEKAQRVLKVFLDYNPQAESAAVLLEGMGSGEFE